MRIVHGAPLLCVSSLGQARGGWFGALRALVGGFATITATLLAFSSTLVRASFLVLLVVVWVPVVLFLDKRGACISRTLSLPLRLPRV